MLSNDQLIPVLIAIIIGLCFWVLNLYIRNYFILKHNSDLIDALSIYQTEIKNLDDEIL